jgi:hypothetical protein
MIRQYFLLFAVVLIVFGLAFIAIDSVSFYKAQQCLTWPSGRAEIISSTVGVKKPYGKNGLLRLYTPEVVFNYSTGRNGGDKKLYSDRPCFFSGGTVNYEVCRRLVARYRPGQTATARFNYDNPAEAVLECKAFVSDFIPLGVVLIGLGAIFLYLMIKKNLEKNEDDEF